jgi:hypothetical protein
VNPNESCRPKSAFQMLAFFVVLVLLSLLVLLFDQSLVEQVRGFFTSGRFPDFAACTRLVAYLIATWWVTKLTGRFPGWLAFPAYGVSLFIFVYAT